MRRPFEELRTKQSCIGVYVECGAALREVANCMYWRTTLPLQKRNRRPARVREKAGAPPKTHDASFFLIS
jgi:hypothetical protein